MSIVYRPARLRKAQQNVGSPFIIPTREPTPELGPSQSNGQSGQPGLIDEIMRGHPKVAKHMSDFRSTLAAANYYWEPVEDEEIYEARFREDMECLMKTAFVDAENDLQGWGYIAESWLQHWSHGMYVAESRFVERRSKTRNYNGLNGLQIELYPIHPSTIMQWNQVDNYRRLASIRQQSVTGGATIDATNLVWVQRGGVIGEYAGESILRPLQYPFGIWKSIWLNRGHLIFAQGGCMIITAPKGAPEGGAAWKRVLKSAANWANGLARFIVAPEGWTCEFVSPSSSTGGEEIETIDAYCDTVLGSQVAALIASANGHRALGEVAANEDTASQSEDLTSFMQRFGDRLAKWVASHIGYDGRMPRLCVRMAEPATAPAERVTAIIAAVQAGLITKTPDIEAEIRSNLGLPELEVAEEVVDPAAVDPAAPIAPDPNAAPMEEAPAGDVAPADAQRAAAAALIARERTPGELRGLSHPTTLQLAKRIAKGEPLSRLELRMLEAWFSATPDPTTAPDYATQGATYQDFQGRGGAAMATWLGSVLNDTDGVPTNVLPALPAPAVA
jgi:hypothetical protein